MKQISRFWPLWTGGIGLLLTVFREQVSQAAGMTFGGLPCPFHALTGLYCPGCGGTRSFLALLHGNLPESLRLNLLPFLLAVSGGMLWTEGLLKLFGKSLHLFPRKQKFWWSAMILFFLWNLIRNCIPVLFP